MKLSLAMIVKNAGETLRPCLLSVVEAVDEVSIVDTGSTDDTLEAIASTVPHDKLRLISWDDPNKEPTRGWISDFAYARNLSFRNCTGDAIIWLDADDVLEHKDEKVDPAASLRSLVEHFFCHVTPKVDFIELGYDYLRDEYGNTLLNVPRYRIVRRGYFDWIYPVHEDLRPLRFVNMAAWGGGDQYVLHRKRKKDERASAERNLWIMERYLAGDGEMNQRLWSNLAGSYLALGDMRSAINCYDNATRSPGADGDALYTDTLRRGDAKKKLGLIDEAMADFSRASLIFPSRRHPYIALAECAADLNDPDRAIAFAETAEKIEAKEEGFIQMTTALDSVPIYSKARAYMLKGQYGQARAAFERLSKQFPGAGDIAEHIARIDQIGDRNNRYGSLLNTAKMVSEPLRTEILKAAPEDLWSMPEIAAARRPKRPKKPSLVIFCGPANDGWGPSSLEQGIGGSEEAVILLSRELANFGWHVEVYAWPSAKDQGMDGHGVVWLPFNAFRPDEGCDVFIGWRQYRHGGAFHNKLHATAAQSWVWLHDTIVPEHFDDSWVAGLDGLFCLSESHAADLPEAYRGKVVQTTNGMNASWFRDGANKPLSFVYASSPDRGLECLLEEWPTIHRALPGSRLHVYYGFNQHYLAACAENPELRRVKASIERLAAAHGVIWHGMVGQDVLAQAFADSGFLLYPCIWKETSCITAMKAMAMGAIPITSRYPASALPETCGRFDLGPPARSGIISNDPAWRQEWRAAVIEAAQTDHTQLRGEMKAWARKTYSWKGVAKQWTEIFRKRSSQAKAELRRHPQPATA